MAVDEDFIDIVDDSQDQKEKLDDALALNSQLERMNNELQEIVDGGGLVNRYSSAPGSN